MLGQALLLAAAAAALHIAPARSGSGDGSNWDNAGQLSDLPAFAARAHGRPIWIRADAGPYQTAPLQLNVGGKDGAPLLIEGVDASGRPAQAELVGTRVSPYAPGGAPGGEVFRLGRGADHVQLQNLSFRDQGVAIRTNADIRDLTIENVQARNVRRFFDTLASGKGATASVEGLVMRRVEITGYSKDGIRLQYDTRKVLIEDVVGDSQSQDGDKFAMGVHMTGTTHDVTFRRVTMKNSHDSTGAYWNGDGFASERDTYDVRFEDTVASGNTDGGYDLKSTNVMLTRTVAEGNKRNYRLWGSGKLTDVVSRDPVKLGGSGGAAHFWFGGDGGKFVIRSPIVQGKDHVSVFTFDSETPVKLEVVKPQLPSDAPRTWVEKGTAAPEISIDGDTGG